MFFFLDHHYYLILLFLNEARRSIYKTLSLKNHTNNLFFHAHTHTYTPISFHSIFARFFRMDRKVGTSSTAWRFLFVEIPNLNSYNLQMSLNCVMETRYGLLRKVHILSFQPFSGSLIIFCQSSDVSSGSFGSRIFLNIHRKCFRMYKGLGGGYFSQKERYSKAMDDATRSPPIPGFTRRRGLRKSAVADMAARQPVFCRI